MLPTLLVVIAADLDVSIVSLGVFLGAARLAGLAAPLAGWLVAKSSAARVLAVSLGGFGVLATGLAAAQTLWVFGPLRPNQVSGDAG